MDLDETVRDIEIDTSMDIVEFAVGDFEVELPGWVETEQNILQGR
jgi:hypothetical protein